MNAPDKDAVLAHLSEQVKQAKKLAIDEHDSAAEHFEYLAREEWIKRLDDKTHAAELMAEAVAVPSNDEWLDLISLVRANDRDGVFNWIDTALNSRMDHEVKVLAKKLEQAHQNERMEA